jgi:hypothetical protein
MLVLFGQSTNVFFAALDPVGESVKKRIAITDHARGQARRRLITEAVVYEVANHPEQSLALRPGREIRQSRVSDPASGKLQLIRVVVDTERNGDVIVTVYRTSKIRRYWRAQ